MLIHRFDTNCGHDNRCAGLALGADGTEQIGRLKAAILWCPWPCATSPPDPCQRTLLTNTGLVAEPDLHRLARRLWRQCRGYESRKLRLKDACASGSLLGCCGRTESRRNDSLCSSLLIPVAQTIDRFSPAHSAGRSRCSSRKKRSPN